MDNSITYAGIKTENVDYESDENITDQIGLVEIKCEILPYNENVYSCTICTERYDTPSELTKHKSNHLNDIISTFACHLSNPTEIRCKLCSAMLEYLPLAVLEMEDARDDVSFGTSRTENHNFDNMVNILESHKNDRLTESCSLYSKVFGVNKPVNSNKCFICGKICTDYLDLENHKLTHIKFQPARVKLEVLQNSSENSTSNLDVECARETNEENSIKQISPIVKGAKARISRELSRLNLNQSDINSIVDRGPSTYSLRRKAKAPYETKQREKSHKKRKVVLEEKDDGIATKFNGVEKVEASQATNGMHKNCFEEIDLPSIIKREIKTDLREDNIDTLINPKGNLSLTKLPVISEGSLILNDINISQPLSNSKVRSHQHQPDVSFTQFSQTVAGMDCNEALKGISCVELTVNCALEHNHVSNNEFDLPVNGTECAGKPDEMHISKSELNKYIFKLSNNIVENNKETTVKAKCLKLNQANTLLNENITILNNVALNKEINQLCDTYLESSENERGNEDYLEEPNRKKIKLSDSNVNSINTSYAKQPDDVDEYIVIVAKDENACVLEATRKRKSIKPVPHKLDICKSPGRENDCTAEPDPLNYINTDPESPMKTNINKNIQNDSIGDIVNDNNFRKSNCAISEVDQIATRILMSVKQKDNFDDIDQRKLFCNIKEKVQLHLNKNALNGRPVEDDKNERISQREPDEMKLVAKDVNSENNFQANQLVIHQFFNLNFWNNLDDCSPKQTNNEPKSMENGTSTPIKNCSKSIGENKDEDVNIKREIDDTNKQLLNHKIRQSKHIKSNASKRKKVDSDNRVNERTGIENVHDEHLPTMATVSDISKDDDEIVPTERTQEVDLDCDDGLNVDGYSTDDDVPLSVLSGIYKYRHNLTNQNRIEYITFVRVENVANVGEEPVPFGTKWTLGMKVLNESGSRLRCGKCKQVVCRSLAVRHVKKHAEYKRYTCDICGELFTTATIMTLHRTECCIIAQRKPKRRKLKSDSKKQRNKKTKKEKSRTVEPRNKTCIACAVLSENFDKYYCYSCNMRFIDSKRFNKHKQSMCHKLMVKEDLKKFFTWDEIHDAHFDNDDDKLLDGDVINTVKEVWLDNFTINFDLGEFESRINQLDCSENSDTWLMISRAESKSKNKCYLCAKHITNCTTHQKTMHHEKMVEWQMKKSLHFIIIHNEENVKSYHKTYSKSTAVNNNKTCIQENTSQVKIATRLSKPHILNATHKSELDKKESCLLNKDETPEAKCQICSMLLKKRDMINHIAHHLENRAFRCEICRKSFIHKSNFIIHKKNVKCINKNSLLKDADCHQKQMTHEQHTCSSKSQRSPQMKFFCNRCNKGFRGKVGFNRHYRYYHATSLKCHVCSRRLSNRIQLIWHLDSHQIVRLKCTFCSRTYSSKSHMMGHLRRFHEKELVTTSSWYERTV